MKVNAYVTLSLLLLVGCEETSPHPRSAPTEVPNASAESLIAGWGDMGMWLPDAEEIAVFRKSFPTAQHLLRNALSHHDRSVRMRGAYVIGKLGDVAKPVGNDLVERLADEPDTTVRMYIVNALNAIGYKTESAIEVLTERYRSLDGSNRPPNADHSYAEVDEKITIASALYALSDDESISEYYNFVTKWLDPPDHNLGGDLLEGYWQRRLIAVNSLERMPDATDAIPKLESLQAERNAKLWVNTHVPRVLNVLRKTARSQSLESK